MLRLGKEELAAAYDRLIESLGDRETAIEARLRKSVEHYGLKERILVQGKNFARELEDVQDVYQPARGISKAEEIISVGQQVTNVLQAKNISPEDKVHMLLSKTLNPFADSSNFSFTALRDTTSPELDRLKVANAADPKVPASLQHAFYEGTEFLDEHKGTVEKIIEE